GVAEPVSIYIDSFHSTQPTAMIVEAVRKVFSLKPAAIIETLDLLRPIYEPTAAYGHFGRTEDTFTWERTDRIEELQEAVGR
ncbi:MAG: methionine adenosyltransferase domain-containing protein, partial [Gemmatimonadota bacterium]|nr:methionine adenosyltransferase domain-containing protein [Gemmatimonadota bacterium]